MSSPGKMAVTLSSRHLKHAESSTSAWMADESQDETKPKKKKNKKKKKKKKKKKNKDKRKNVRPIDCTQQNKKQKVGVKQGDTRGGYVSFTPLSKRTFLKTEEDCETHREILANKGCGWVESNGKGRTDVWWKKHNCGKDGTGHKWQTYYCPFNKTTCCPHEIKYIERDQLIHGELFKFEFVNKTREGKTLCHGSHDKTRPEEVFPMYMKLFFTKKFCTQYNKTKQAVGFFKTEVLNPDGKTRGVPVSKDLKNAIGNLLRRKKKIFTAEKSGVTVAVGKTYGGIAQAIKKYNINPVTRGFHEPFVIASWLDSQTEYIIIIMSSDNLLLNGYRMYCEPGVTACIQIDCTYKLMKEGFSLAVIGSVSVDQKFHPIAYAVCNKENTATFEFILGEVRDAIEGLVEKKRAESTGTGTGSK